MCRGFNSLLVHHFFYKFLIGVNSGRSFYSGGLDTLPHNGAVLTLLAVSNCTHKESYIDICITTCIIPLVSSLGLALIWGLFL